jgi:hypothetical protein
VYPVSRDLRSLPARSPLTSQPSARRIAPVRSVAAADVSVEGDVEVSIRLFADGRSISVRRRVAPGPDGESMTVGIDALIR